MASIFKSLKILDLLKHSQCFMNTDNMQYLAWWNIVSSFHSPKLLLNITRFLQCSTTHFSPACKLLWPSSSDTLKLVQVNTSIKNIILPSSCSSCTFLPLLSFPFQWHKHHSGHVLNNSPHPQTVHSLAASIPVLHTALLHTERSSCKQPKQGIRHWSLCNSLKYLLNYSLRS